MMLFRTAAAAITLGLVSAPAAYAQDAEDTSVDAPDDAPDDAKIAIARQIIDLGYPEAEREALFFGTMDQMMIQMREAMEPTLPEGDPGALDILNTWLDEYLVNTKVTLRTHIPAIMDGMALGYAGLFTEEELLDILGFVSTPSGQKFVQNSAEILSQPAFAAANQNYMNDVMSDLVPAREDLQERLLEYFLNKEAEEAVEEA